MEAIELDRIVDRRVVQARVNHGETVLTSGSRRRVTRGGGPVRMRPVDSSTGYARSGDAHIGYTIEGTGPLDLLYVSTFTISIDSYDEEPHAAHYCRRLGVDRAADPLRRARSRNVGSDRHRAPTRQWRARLATSRPCSMPATSSRAVVVAEAGGGIGAIEFAATRPERVAALVLVNVFARLIADVGYPVGHPRDLVERFLEQNMDPDEDWTEAGADDVALIAPSMRDDPQFRDWWVRASRRGASPASARAIIGLVSRADVRDRLPEITAPTLVLHRSENLFVPVGLGRFVGEHIPGARFVALPGADHAPFTGDADEIVDEIEEFLTGQRTGGGERVLASVVFTDIVDSTRRAAALGDAAWRGYLDAHDAIVRRGAPPVRRARESTRPATAFSPRSRARRRPCAVRTRSSPLPRAATSQFAPGCTPASASGAATTSPGSPCTSRRASPRSRPRGRCWCRVRSETWSAAPVSASPIAASTS